MPDILVTDIEPDLYEALRRIADRRGLSIEEIAREALEQEFKTVHTDASGI